MLSERTLLLQLVNQHMSNIPGKMYCLSKNLCYVCMQNQNSIQRISRTNIFSNELLHKLNYCSFNMKWAITKHDILICDKCCETLQNAYEFITMCHKSSILFRSYVYQLEHTTDYNNKKSQGQLNIVLENIANIKQEAIIDNSDNFSPQASINANKIESEILNHEQQQPVEQPATNIEFCAAVNFEVKQENINTNVSDYLETFIEVKNEAVDITQDYVDSNSSEYVTSGIFVPQENSLNNQIYTRTEADRSKQQSVQRERPYICFVCNKSFSQKCHLNQHHLTHTGEKPYSCIICNTAFLRKSQLMVHQLIHTGEKPHLCTVCNKSFLRKQHLDEHKLIHSGEKPHQCLHCPKNFTLKKHLIRHQLVHTREKPFMCPVCNVSFSLKAHLMQHQTIHTGEKPYKCLLCNKCFRTKYSLNRHQQTHY